MNARIQHLHVKPRTPGERGIPKLEVPLIHATAAGVDGDYNRYRHESKRDDPDKAVMFIPAEILVALRAEGWPVEPGHLGENLTVTELANAAVVIGQRYQIGDVLQIEISRTCDPCRNLAVLPYVGEQRVNEFIRTTLGRRGWYARVVQPGVAKRGDAMIRLPNSQ